MTCVVHHTLYHVAVEAADVAGLGPDDFRPVSIGPYDGAVFGPELHATARVEVTDCTATVLVACPTMVGSVCVKLEPDGAVTGEAAEMLSHLARTVAEAAYRTVN